VTFVIVFLLPIFLVPGGTERPEAAAAGFCYISNHGHSYQVDCWRWHIAHWCERGRPARPGGVDCKGELMVLVLELSPSLVQYRG